MPREEKRSLEEAESMLEGIKAIVFNIEGTLTPISFVKDKLFPYLIDNLGAYLSTHYDEKETQADIAALRSLAEKDKEAGQKVSDIPAAANGNKEAVIKALVEIVTQQMNEDRKSTELKQFQEHVWREAYKTKKVQGELFEDVAPMLQQLSEEDFMLYIYSSETVELQKLMLANSTEGDISEMFTDFFDSSVGSKTEVDSYKNVKTKIDQDLAIESEEILYLTDSPEEAKAANEAGWQTVLVDRSMEQEGGVEFGDEVRQNYQVIESLNELESMNELFGDDDNEEEEAYGAVKRARMAGNGKYEEDEDDEGLDGEEGEDFGEEEEEGDEEDEEA